MPKWSRTKKAPTGVTGSASAAEGVWALYGSAVTVSGAQTVAPGPRAARETGHVVMAAPSVGLVAGATRISLQTTSEQSLD